MYLINAIEGNRVCIVVVYWVAYFYDEELFVETTSLVVYADGDLPNDVDCRIIQTNTRMAANNKIDPSLFRALHKI